MKLGLMDQSILITGSSKGIGRAIAEGYLKEKASIILTGRDELALNKTTIEFKKFYIMWYVIFITTDHIIYS